MRNWCQLQVQLGKQTVAVGDWLIRRINQLWTLPNNERDYNACAPATDITKLFTCLLFGGSECVYHIHTTILYGYMYWSSLLQPKGEVGRFLGGFGPMRPTEDNAFLSSNCFSLGLFLLCLASTTRCVVCGLAWLTRTPNLSLFDSNGSGSVVENTFTAHDEAVTRSSPSSPSSWLVGAAFGGNGSATEPSFSLRLGLAFSVQLRSRSEVFPSSQGILLHKNITRLLNKVGT